MNLIGTVIVLKILKPNIQIKKVGKLKMKKEIYVSKWTPLLLKVKQSSNK
jgi:hypothetical protein